MPTSITTRMDSTGRHKQDTRRNQRKEGIPQELTRGRTGRCNVFNSEEPSMSYLQLPTRKSTDDNRLCSKCGGPGHWK